MTVDTVAPTFVPTINSYSPDTGVVGDHVTNFSMLTLTGNGQANSTVGVYDGSTLLGTVTANGSGAWSYTTNELPNGTHQFTARTMDVAGNTSAASAALAVTVNATPNLLANGSFETGSTSGWTESGQTGAIYIAPTDYPGEVHTGTYSVGLGGYTRSDGVLTQSIATTAGQHYTVSFWLRVQLYTFDVVGIAGNSTLEFRGYNIPDSMRLDDISVTAATSAPPVAAPVITSFSNDTGTAGDGATPPGPWRTPRTASRRPPPMRPATPARPRQP
jgi:hypothetical protein